MVRICLRFSSLPALRRERENVLKQLVELRNRYDELVIDTLDEGVHWAVKDAAQEYVIRAATRLGFRVYVCVGPRAVRDLDSLAVIKLDIEQLPTVTVGS